MEHFHLTLNANNRIILCDKFDSVSLSLSAWMYVCPCSCRKSDLSEHMKVINCHHVHLQSRETISYHAYTNQPLKAAKQRTKECLYLEWIWAIVCAEEKKTSNQVLIKYDKVAPLSLQSSQDLSSFFNR